MVVFDAVTRTDSSPKGAESTFAFLNRVAGEYWDAIREMADEWTQGFCDNGRADLIGRLQSGDDVASESAWWELLLHRSQERLGVRVTCHPQVPGTPKGPGFLVESDDCSFYLEATTAQEDPEGQKREDAYSRIYDELNARVSSDLVHLRVDFDKDGGGNLPISRRAGSVQWPQRLLRSC